MSLIRVKYDPTLKHSDIIARLDNTNSDEVDEKYVTNYTDMQQTSIYGIQCPIIAVNNIMIAYDDILDFTLEDTSTVPMVNMIILDRKNLIKMLDTPRQDNELRIEILPPFDDAYKKINLTFIISSYDQLDQNALSISGTYKSPELFSSQYKSFGEVSLYQLMDQIASEVKLGFATNVEDAQDKRFVYCPFNNYIDLIQNEVEHSGDETHIYDWWIDVWNYLTLCDMYERYNAIDSEEDTNLWISNQTDEVTNTVEIQAQKSKSEFSNLFGMEESQLYVKAYRTINNIGSNISVGNDKIYSVYSMNDREYKDTNIQFSGDEGGETRPKDIFKNFEYQGEVYGDYDYITGGMLREPFLQKMNNELLEIDLAQPLLGIQRGKRLNFACYYDNSMFDNTNYGLEDAGLVNDNIKTNVPVEEMGQDYQSDTFKLNKFISGQYLIIGNRYTFRNKKWTQTVILTRPAEQTPKILKDDDKL